MILGVWVGLGLGVWEWYRGFSHCGCLMGMVSVGWGGEEITLAGLRESFCSED